MWVEGKQRKRDKRNIHKELFTDTKGFLTEREAQRWIVKYFRSNVVEAVEHTMGVRLFPFQEMIIKTMLQKDYVLGILSRGIGKSFSTAIYAGLEAMMTPNCRIAIISKTFRQSRLLFQTLEDLSFKPEASLLAECMNGKAVHANDQWTMKFVNGSVIMALPLGDGSKLRGFRFNCIIIDEMLLMPDKVLNEVIMPFLSTNANVDQRSEAEIIYAKAIAAGIITQEDYDQIKRTHPLFKNNKMIGLSSASYQFEYLYKLYQDYVSKITKGTNDGKELLKDGSNKLEGTYAIFQMSYDIAPMGLYNESLLEKSKSEMSKAQFMREFGSQFTDESSGYFSVSSIEKCTAAAGAYPCGQLKGKSKSSYLIAVDPNASESDVSDFFAMVVFRIEDDGRFTQVHTYGIAGARYNEHIRYFHYLLKNFNTEFVVMDNAGGIQFLRACQESKIFKDDPVPLDVIEGVDLTVSGVEVEEKELRNLQKTYNQAAGRIVYFQKFTADWARQSNEDLQFSVDSGQIKWASDISAIDSEFQYAQKIDIGIEKLVFTGEENIDFQGNIIEDDYKKFSKKEAKTAKQIDFIEHQEFLMTMTRRQIASIEPRVNASGNSIQFVLPKELQNQKGKNRARRDLYTAVLMANWVSKKFIAMRNLKDIDPEDWLPAMF